MTICDFHPRTPSAKPRLPIGPNRIIRTFAPASEEKIQRGDWMRAVTELPGAAEAALDELGPSMAETFLSEPVARYTPQITP